MGLNSLLLLHHALQGQADQMRAAQRRRVRRQGATNAELNERIDELEDDLGYVTLVLSSLLCRLDEKGLVTQDDLRSLVSELDDVDGVRDGKLDVNLLKELTEE